VGCFSAPFPAAVLLTAIALLFAAALAAPPDVRGAGPPQIESLWVTEVSDTSANLRAKIDPNGFKTSYRFEYITDEAFQANPPEERFAGALATPLQTLPEPPTVAKHVEPLARATVYHYRAVATNSAGAAVDPPEHTFTTKVASEAFGLPDGRAWELVSPVDKGGGAIAAPGGLFGGGDIQAAPGAAVLTYGSATAFSSSVGAPPASQYVSRRTGSGWATENISTPLESGAYGDEPDGAPYRVFSEDLSRALLFGGLACRGGLEGCPAPNFPLPGSGAPAGYMAYYLRDNAHGALSSLLGLADVAHSAVSPQSLEVAFAAASPDLSHVVLSSCAALTANAIEVPLGPEGCDPEAANLYEWSSAGLQAINLLPGDTSATPGAEIAAPIGAVSADGSRVYWSEGGNLYLRDGAQTVRVDESAGGGGTFQTASVDGSIGFFTKAGHLYRYDVVAKAASDLTPSGGVQGVLGASADGSVVYYQDALGVERWHNDTVTEVIAGAGATVASDYPPATATARVSPGGEHLTFLSEVELSGIGLPAYDNTDATTGQPDAELFVYGPPVGGGAPILACASCNPTGERPEGSASIPGALVNGTTRAYRPRALSTDGSRLFFESGDDLSVSDTNKDLDVYEWERNGAGDCHRSPGCLRLISSGRESNGGATFLDATADGSDVFFLTNESLLKSDPGSIDAYDAKVGGGFSESTTIVDCLGDACQSLPAPPEDPTPGTLRSNPGNPRLRVLKPKSRTRIRKIFNSHKKKAGKKRAHRRRHGR
jgi:hypothetical protein